MGGMASLRRLLLDHLLGRASARTTAAGVARQRRRRPRGPDVRRLLRADDPSGRRVRDRGGVARGGHDKIRAGKALAVLAGGFDDLTPEGMLGFADMGATASQRGRSRRWASRRTRPRGPTTCAARASSRPRAAERSSSCAATSRSRSGCRCAACSPTRAASATACTRRSRRPAWARWRARAAARGRRSTATASTADDIAVVSKHDTSTEMNDPAEADLHERLQTRSAARPATRCSSSPRRRSPATPRAAPPRGSSTASCGCSRPASSRATATSRASTRSSAATRHLDARRPPDPALAEPLRAALIT